MIFGPFGSWKEVPWSCRSPARIQKNRLKSMKTSNHYCRIVVNDGSVNFTPLRSAPPVMPVVLTSHTTAAVQPAMLTYWLWIGTGRQAVLSPSIRKVPVLHTDKKTRLRTHDWHLINWSSSTCDSSCWRRRFATSFSSYSSTSRPLFP